MFKPEVRHFVPSVSVVGDDYCFSYLVSLTVNKRIGISDKHVEVLDADGIPLVKVEGSFWQFKKKKRMMYDQFGAPLITMERKGISLHPQWIVYAGDCNHGSNVLYAVRKSHSFQLKGELEVFLASNSKEEISDFRVVGSYFSQSFKVYEGENVIAKVKERSKLGRLGIRESFEARIYPGIDYAFIASLLVIFIENNMS